MNAVRDGLAAIARSVAEHADELGRLDSIAGDGDLGATMARVTALLDERVDDLAGLPPTELLARVGALVAREAPSTSGTLLSFGLAEGSRRIAGLEGGAAVAAALRGIADGIAEIGGAGPGDKTMLDALIPAAEAAGSSASDPREVLAAAAAAARTGAAATAEMTPRFGRASWTAERSRGSVDGGATLIAVILAALAEG